MTAIRVFLARLRGLLPGNRRDRALQEEVQFHLAMEEEENLRRGMQSREAYFAARRNFGGIAQVEEVYREFSRVSFLEHLGRDVRFALRMLRKCPGVALAVILTIALGVGLNTGVFTVLNGLTLRPLGVPRSDRLVSIYQTFRGHYRRGVYGAGSLFSYPEYLQYAGEMGGLSGLAGYSHILHVSLAGSAQRVDGTLASCNYFEVLESPPALGRGFLPGECAAPGAGSVVVLSSEVWRNLFGGDPAIIGRTIRLNRQPMLVVGVAAPGFHGTELEPAQFWTPLVNANMALAPGDPDPNFLGDDNLSWLGMVGRLRDGVPVAEARAAARVIAGRIDQRHPGRSTQLSVATAKVVDLPEERTDVFAAGLVALLAVGLVLMIGCANLINLMLARAAGRRREIAVRLAIGARRSQLVRQLATESLLLALIGGLLGTLVAVFSERALLTAIIAHLPPDTPNFAVNAAPDLLVFAYSLVLMVVTGLLVGLIPALQATRTDLSSALKQEGGEVAAGGRGRLRATLVGVQVAVCALLLMSAGLLVHGLYRGEHVEPGFDAINVAALHLDLGGYDRNDSSNLRAGLLERLRADGNVVGVATVQNTPLAGRIDTSDFARSDETQMYNFGLNRVSQNYFAVMGIPLTRGRTFTADEIRREADVTIVTEATARALWPGQEPIGQRLHDGKRQVEVIGVSGDTRSQRLTELDSPFMYLPLPPAAPQDIVVRFRGTYPALVRELRAAVRATDPEVTANVFRIDQNVVTWIAPVRVAVVLVALLAAAALVLATIGVYGTAAYATSRRVREISIRMMLGAQRQDVLRMVLRQALRPALAGAATGAVLSVAVAKLLSSALFGVSAVDALSLGPVALLLAAVALLAAYLPARRIVPLEPLEALRHE